MVEETTPVSREETKPLSIVEEAKAIRDEILKAKEELQAENDRRDKQMSEALLSGSSGGNVKEEPKKEISPEDYAEMALNGGIKDE